MPPVVVPRTRTNTKTLASMVANDIEPDIGSVTAALQETNIDDRRHAIARIASTLASPIRTKTAQAIATSTLAAGTDAATIVAIARALVPPEFLKAAKAGQIQQNPAMQVIDALVRAARDLTYRRTNGIPTWKKCVPSCVRCLTKPRAQMALAWHR